MHNKCVWPSCKDVAGFLVTAFFAFSAVASPFDNGAGETSENQRSCLKFFPRLVQDLSFMLYASPQNHYIVKFFDGYVIAHFDHQAPESITHVQLEELKNKVTVTRGKTSQMYYLNNWTAQKFLDIYGPQFINVEHLAADDIVIDTHAGNGTFVNFLRELGHSAFGFSLRPIDPNVKKEFIYPIDSVYTGIIPDSVSLILEHDDVLSYDYDVPARQLAVLKEYWRILKMGGKLRVAAGDSHTIPSLQKLAAALGGWQITIHESWMELKKISKN